MALWSVCLPFDNTRTFAWVRSSLRLAIESMKLVGVTAMHVASTACLNDTRTPAVTTFGRRKGLTSLGKIEVDEGYWDGVTSCA